MHVLAQDFTVYGMTSCHVDSKLALQVEQRTEERCAAAKRKIMIIEANLCNDLVVRVPFESLGL